MSEIDRHDEARDAAPSLSRSGFDAFLTSGAMLALGLVSSVAVARGLGPARKGGYDLLVATGAMLSLILSLHLPTGVTYVVARGRVSLASLKPDLWRFVGVEGMAAALVLVAAGVLLEGEWGDLTTGWEGSQPVVVGALLVAFVMLSSVASLWRGILIGRQQIVRANRRDLAVRALQVGLVTAVVVCGVVFGKEIPPAAVYAATVVAAAVAAVMFVVAVRRPGNAPTNGDPGRGARAFREAMKFSMPTYLANLVQVANYRLDLFFIAFFVGTEQVGIYAIAVVLSQLPWLVPRAVALVLLPSTASAQEQTRRNSERAAMGARVALWGAVVTCSALAVLGTWLIPVFFGSDFSASAGLLLWLLPGACLLSPATVMASFVAGVGRPALNLVVSLVGLIATVVLDLTLIPSSGAKGAAIASSVSYSMSAVLMTAVFLVLSTASLGDVLVPKRGDLAAVMRAARSAVARREVPR